MIRDKFGHSGISACRIGLPCVFFAPVFSQWASNTEQWAPDPCFPLDPVQCQFSHWWIIHTPLALSAAGLRKTPPSTISALPLSKYLRLIIQFSLTWPLVFKVALFCYSWSHTRGSTVHIFGGYVVKYICQWMNPQLFNFALVKMSCLFSTFTVSHYKYSGYKNSSHSSYNGILCNGGIDVKILKTKINHVLGGRKRNTRTVQYLLHTLCLSSRTCVLYPCYFECISLFILPNMETCSLLKVHWWCS